MKKGIWISLCIVSILLFGSGFLLGRSNALASEYVHTSLTGKGTSMSSMALFQYVWNVLEAKHPFASPTEEERMYKAIAGLAAAYNDPYTAFFDPKESKDFNDEMQGSFGGVGMELGIKNDVITVIAPLPDTPAFKAGIVAGDTIRFIDQESTVGMTVDAAVQRIRGTVGTSVLLGILTKEGKEKTLSLVRETIRIPALETEVRGNVFIIRLYSFTEDASDLFKQALDTYVASGKNRLIIDLRNNPGGYFIDAIEISSWFLPEGKIIVRENYGPNTQETVHRSKGFKLPVTDQKIVVLINQGSASASEIVAGALADHEVATLVGKESYGKGSVQEFVALPNGTSLKVTVAEWFTPLGQSLLKKGLTPTVIVENLREDVVRGNDAQLEKALELLN